MQWRPAFQRPLQSHCGMQVQHLQHSLQNSQQQSAILRTELQHRCDQVDDLTRDHNALLTKFRELTVLMSEAHNKLNTAVAQSGKAMAKDHSKVGHKIAQSLIELAMDVKASCCCQVFYCIPLANYELPTCLKNIYGSCNLSCMYVELRQPVTSQACCGESSWPSCHSIKQL